MKKVNRIIKILGIGISLLVCFLLAVAGTARPAHAVDVVGYESTGQATFTASVALTTGNVVYVVAGTGFVALAGADLKIAAYGIVAAGKNVAVASGALVNIVRQGKIIGESGLTVNGAVYLSQTAGGYTQTVGVNAFLQPIGVARSATVIDFNIEPSYTAGHRLPDTQWELVNEFNDLTDWDTTNAWVLTTTEGGSGDATETIGDTDYGILTLTNDDGDNDLDSAQSIYEIISLTANKRTLFQARFRLNEATENDVAIGLCVRDTTPITSPSDTVYFLKSDDSTDWDFVSTSVSNAVTVSAVDTADTSWHTFAFVCDGLTSCTPYIDGVVNTAITSASAIPATNMGATLHIQNGDSGTNRTLEIDYIRISQER